ncbi:MAG: TonB-dependent receptor [Gemmatimonadota bacterium]|nr:TonB-dependent receptor [Gemmatimonadota bacterium]MDH5759083.1 TonB-dependent receptor [Gemmatimonadota bacterium]
MSGSSEGKRKRTPFRWMFGCWLVLATFGAAPASAQNGTITGMVSEAGTMQPVNSVQVYLLDTSLGTLSAQNGRFLILNVPAGTYQIRAERIGYEMVTQDVTVTSGGTSQVDFTLSTQALALDELVVTGTAGAARRREIGNSISQVNLADLPEPAVSTDAILQGRVAGMTVLQSSGMAGSGAQIRLRGNVSVSMSNQPIIYIDGVRIRSDGYAKNVPPVGYAGRSSNDIVSPLNDIHPSDIERIEVLKGAAATTLYGTEAAAGVIQIFTKRGHTGQARWTAQIDQGVAWELPFGPSADVCPPSELAKSEALGVGTCQSASGGRPEYLYIDPWLRNAWRQKYSLSVAGGGEALQYFVSGNWDDNEGVLPNDMEEKGVIRGNFTFTPLTNLQLQWNTSFTQNRIENTAAGNNAHGLTLNAFRRDRNYLGDETREAIDPFLNQEITTKINHLVTGITATYSPTSNFTNRLTTGYDLSQVNLRNLRPFGFVRAQDGILSDQRVEYQNVTLDYVGTYDFKFGEGMRSSFSWGGQSISTQVESTSAYGQDFPGPGEPTVSSAGTTLGFEARQRVINAGFFVQNLLDINNKYFITAGVRVDGNSAFGEALGLEAYPKVSASYVVSDEDFWNDGWGQMKLRAAWGQSGRAPGAFDKVRTYSPAGWGGDPAFLPLNVGNDQIGPERTSELEFGFDGSFVDSRLSLDVTYYLQKTTDALFNVRQIPSLGFLSSQLANVGELSNKGMEIVASFAAVQSESWQLDIGGSLSTNSSEVVDLPDEVPAFSIGNYGWVDEGQPIPVIRGYCVTNPDALAEPVIESECDYGPNQPTHIIQGFVTVGLPAGVSLTARGEYQGGHYISDGAAYNAVRRSVIWPGCYEAYSLNETQGRDAVTAMDRARCLDIGTIRGDYFIYPSDFFKLRELTLQAPIPDGVIPGASRATLTVSGRNMWKWVNKDFPVFEPEMGGNSGYDESVRGLLEHVPPPATFTASLRLVF